MIGFEMQAHLAPLDRFLHAPLRKRLNEERRKPPPPHRFAYSSHPLAYYASSENVTLPSYLIGRVYQEHNAHLGATLDLIKSVVLQLPREERMQALALFQSCQVKAIAERFCVGPE